MKVRPLKNYRLEKPLILTLAYISIIFLTLVQLSTFLDSLTIMMYVRIFTKGPHERHPP